MTNESLTLQFRQQAQGALSLNIAYIGVVNGLFATLERLGSASSQQLAKQSAMDQAYVLRWCDAAFAFGYLEEDAVGFRLSPSGSAMCPDSKETLMPIAIQSILSAHMAERAAALMRTGERPGESTLAERTTVLPWFGRMLEANFSSLFNHTILPQIPAYAQVNQQHGLVVDLGCGNGWYLRSLAQHFPHLRGFGLDGFAENIRQAQEKSQSSGLANRLQFHCGDIHQLQLPEPVQLIAMNRALHHVFEKDPETLIDWMLQQLTPGGYVVIWEPAWPNDRSRLHTPALRAMAFQNLSEHVQGNHFLHPEEIRSLFSRRGMQTSVSLFNQDTEAVIVAQRATMD